MSIVTESSEAVSRVRGGRNPPPRIGEELPIFCERCGYSLHGLPQVRCEGCAVLQFHCPECGHHQPINTLRPAAQAILGRLRAAALVCSVLFRIGLFIALLMIWFGIGIENSYEYNDAAHYRDDNNQYVEIGPRRLPAEVGWEQWLGFGIYGFIFGCITRMTLLRWRRGWLVGVAVAMLMVIAASLGPLIEWWDSFDHRFRYPQPFTRSYIELLAYAMGLIVFGATVVWPVWVGLVTVFLPRRAGQALLDWQRAMSGGKPPGPLTAAFAREPHASGSTGLSSSVSGSS